jgi:hypothetical protein
VVASLFLERMRHENHIKLPKQRTNPRGVEMTWNAMKQLLANQKTYGIPINWKKEKIDFRPFDRWVELWQMD